MRIVILRHPDFFHTASMSRFAYMIAGEMEARGHQVSLWTSRKIVYLLPSPRRLKKWLGYIDQFLIFPLVLACRLLVTPKDTVFVVADQALGMWVPLVASRPHAIHCHDLLAFQSSKDAFTKLNDVTWTGKIYQELIRRGFSKGRNFICVSHATKHDLQCILPDSNKNIEVVYNGLNFDFFPVEYQRAVEILKAANIVVPPNGFLLHVGGNQWYKNRKGLLHLYRDYCALVEAPLPLWLIGQAPTSELQALARQCSEGSVSFIVGLDDDAKRAAYSLAKLMIFPSIAEGFGWPIVEAMACGCPVMTTGAPPMSEIGGEVASYIPSMLDYADSSKWARESAEILRDVIARRGSGEASQHKEELAHATSFSKEQAIDGYEREYALALTPEKRVRS